MAQKLQITEWQNGVAESEKWPLGEGDPAFCYRGRVSDYRYGGMQDGLHVFIDSDGKRELFARRTSHSGWQLRRGKWVYEFVTDAGPDRTPRMAARIARFVRNGAPRYVHVYDDGGEGDRYTVVFTGRYRHQTNGSFWHMGISEFGTVVNGESNEQIDYPSYGHLGRKIGFFDLPVACQTAVVEKYAYLWDLDQTVLGEIVVAHRPAQSEAA